MKLLSALHSTLHRYIVYNSRIHFKLLKPTGNFVEDVILDCLSIRCRQRRRSTLLHIAADHDSRDFLHIGIGHNHVFSLFLDQLAELFVDFAKDSCIAVSQPCFTFIWVYRKLTIRSEARSLKSAVQIARDIVNKMLLLIFLLSKRVPDLSWLLEVLISDEVLKGGDVADPFFVVRRLLVLSRRHNRWRLKAGNVVGNRPIVHEVCCAVTLGWIIAVERSICGQLRVIDTETIALSVPISEETNLED